MDPTYLAALLMPLLGAPSEGGRRRIILWKIIAPGDSQFDSNMFVEGPRSAFNKIPLPTEVPSERFVIEGFLKI